MTPGKAKSKSDKSLIYVIAGKEASLVSAEYDRLLAELLSPEQRSTALFDADPAQTPISQVLDELRTLPFLADKRVVAVRNADKFVSANRELLERYFDNPCSTGVLVLTVENWDSRTRLAKKLPKVGRLVSVKKPSEQELPRRLIDYAAEAHDKKLSQLTARLLVELAGDDLQRLYGEIDKLAIYAGDKSGIGPEDVEAIVGHNRLFNTFAVIDAVLGGDLAAAVDRLRKTFAEDRSAQYTVVGAFAYHFRRMFNAKVLLAKGLRPDEVSNRLRIWYNKQGFLAAVRKFSLGELAGIMRRLAEMDFRIKTGQTNAMVAAEELVVELIRN